MFKAPILNFGIELEKRFRAEKFIYCSYCLLTIERIEEVKHEN